MLASFHAVWAIACYRILTGMANGFAFLAGLRVSALLFPKKLSLMTGLFVALGMSDDIVAGNLYAFVATNSGWPMVFTVNVSIGFLFWVLMLLLLDNVRKCDAVSLQTAIFLSALLAALVMFGIIYMPAFSLIILCVLFLLLGFFTSGQMLILSCGG